MATESGQSEPRGHEAVTQYLEGQNVAFELVEHDQTFSAADEAQASGVTPDHAAKTMVLRDGDDYRLAVIPASHRIDMHKARETLDASGHLRLATEDEMGADFGDFEVGATPPLGSMLGAPEVLDRRLLDHEKILCTGGDHTHSVLISPQDLAELTKAKVGDVCED
jgi:Ala-tRNA(Pro) deacylase